MSHYAAVPLGPREIAISLCVGETAGCSESTKVKV